MGNWGSRLGRWLSRWQDFSFWHAGELSHPQLPRQELLLTCPADAGHWLKGAGDGGRLTGDTSCLNYLVSASVARTKSLFISTETYLVLYICSVDTSDSVHWESGLFVHCGLKWGLLCFTRFHHWAWRWQDSGQGDAVKVDQHPDDGNNFFQWHLNYSGLFLCYLMHSVLKWLLCFMIKCSVSPPVSWGR